MTTEHLLTLRAKLSAKLELIDELLGAPAAGLLTAVPTPPSAPAPATPPPSAPATHAEVPAFPKAPPRPRADPPDPPAVSGGSKPTTTGYKLLPFGDVGRLLESGPKSQKDLADALECHPMRVRATLEHHTLLFEKVDHANRLSKWRLTEEGLDELGDTPA